MVTLMMAGNIMSIEMKKKLITLNMLRNGMERKLDQKILLLVNKV